MHEDMSKRPRKGKAFLWDAKILAEALSDFVDRPCFTTYTKDRKYNKTTVDQAYLMHVRTQKTIAAVTREILTAACAPSVWMEALKQINKG